MWKYVGNSCDGEPFFIGGIDVWSVRWEQIIEEIAEVRDPQYHQLLRFEVYQATQGNKTVEFAAGEFSNGIWGFYVR
jgi:hypothetical protein